MGAELGLYIKGRIQIEALANRMLTRICCPKRNQVTGEWGKWHNEELHNFCPSRNIMR
jgi:hypothetical protein